MFERTDKSCTIWGMNNGDYFTMESHYFQVIDKGEPNHNAIVYNLTRGKLYRIPAYSCGTICKLVD